MYDRSFFDAGVDRRHTRCEKWDGMEKQTGAGMIPLWVADMDFASPPEVQQAIAARAGHGVYGYTEVLPDDAHALAAFWHRRHGVDYDPAWVGMLPCVVTGIKLGILAFTQPGDKVLIESPVYGPFRFSVEATGRTLVDVPLVRGEDGRYSRDLNALEAALREGVKLMVLCSPHNPVSRVWTREELQALCALLRRYGVMLISDEIHADFVYAPGRFTPILSVCTQNTVALCAASKTFNLAGLQQASFVCPDEALRSRLTEQMARCGTTSGNVFALEATRTAYRQGDAWLDGLLAYLDSNRQIVRAFVDAQLPGAVLTPIEGTYLAWLDLRAWYRDEETLRARCRQAGVELTYGAFFGGKAWEGFARLNFGCPESMLREGLERLERAMQKVKREE